MDKEHFALLHAGICVRSKNEMEDFYQNILGFRQKYSFVIDVARAKALFDIEHEIEVFLLERKSVRIELFIADRMQKSAIQHLCFEMPFTNSWLAEVEQSGFLHHRFVNSHSKQTIFLKDKSGNLFEIKEI